MKNQHYEHEPSSTAFFATLTLVLIVILIMFFRHAYITTNDLMYKITLKDEQIKSLTINANILLKINKKYLNQLNFIEKNNVSIVKFKTLQQQNLELKQIIKTKNVKIESFSVVQTKSNKLIKELIASLNECKSKGD